MTKGKNWEFQWAVVGWINIEPRRNSQWDHSCLTQWIKLVEFAQVNGKRQDDDERTEREKERKISGNDEDEKNGEDDNDEGYPVAIKMIIAS